MKNAHSFRSTADDSASLKRPAAPASAFQLRVLVRAALLIAVIGGSLAAVARHHGWLASLGNGDSTSQVAPALAAEPDAGPTGAFTRIDVPGAGKSAMEGTFAIAINTAGEVTGMYSVSPGTLHGFVRDRLGAITKFDASDSGTGAIEGTIPLSINTAGEIAGTIIDSSHVSHGFVRSVSGALTEFEAPSAGTVANRGTAAWRINDAGDVVGFFSTTGDSSTPPTYHGFLRKAADGKFTQIDAPGAGTGVNPSNGKKQGTQAYSINNAGEIVGSYVDSNNDRHGFTYTNGVFKEFDAPGAITSTSGHKQGLNGTLPTGIDADGVVVGTFTDAKGRHGFVRNTDGTFEIFNGPGAAANSALISGTFAFYIDSSTGAVVGVDSDGSGLYHAFERSPAGTVTEIKPPGSVASTLTILPGAGAGGVNEYGDVAGGYSDAGGVYHGFIFTPASTAKVLAPAFSPRQGSYVGKQSVKISDATAGATIYYTTDNSVPPTSKTTTKYAGPVTIAKTGTIKAVAEKAGYTNSSVANATYTILKAQTISWARITGTYFAKSTLTLKATASSGLAVSFASETPKVCTVSKDTASLLTEGNCTIRATQAGNAVYGPAPPVSQTLVVKSK